MVAKSVSEDNQLDEASLRDLGHLWRSKIPRNIQAFRRWLFLNCLLTKLQLARKWILEGRYCLFVVSSRGR